MKGAGALYGSSYYAALEQDNPLGIWFMNNGTSGVADLSGSGTLSYTSTSFGTDGPLDGNMTFDGTSGIASVPVNLSGSNSATLETWCYWNSFDNTNKLMFEYTPNYNSSTGFLINPNSSSTPGFFEIASSNGGGGYKSYGFARPSAAVWHHYSFVLSTASGIMSCMVDGVTQSLTQYINIGITAPSFANSSLYIMQRSGGVAKGAGRLAGMAIFSGVLSDERRIAHYKASKP